MQCYTVDGSGLDGLVLSERPAPSIESGDVLVDVHAVSLNFRDLMVARGEYGPGGDAPIIAGSDMAGVVSAVGDAVTTLKPGDRVFNAPFRFWPAGNLQPEWTRTFVGGGGVDGVLAEQVAYPAHALVPVPKGYSFAEASTLTIAGLTAWSGLVSFGQARPGQWALLHGTGGVSIFAAQLAQAMGVRTIVTTGSTEKAAIVRAGYGVSHTVDYHDHDWPAQVRDLSGGGVNIVLDVAGGPTFADSISACALEGRIALIGVLDGVEATIDTVAIIMRRLVIQGILMESTQELRDFARACETYNLQPRIDRVYPFDEARIAYDYLESQKHIGKVVIQLRDS
jgi:NADPH:quinone reductase-like Zn-dependent oxidoreductase